MPRFREHEWDRRYADRGLLWTANPNRFLVAETSELPAARALDLATGEGRDAVWLAEQGWQVVGVDFSRVGLQKARKLAGDRGVEVDWLQADLLDYRPEPRTFDLVLVFYLQVPQEDRQPILAAAATAVAPGGTLLLAAHDKSNLKHGHGGPKDASVLYTPRRMSCAILREVASRSSALPWSNDRSTRPRVSAPHSMRLCALAVPDRPACRSGSRDELDLHSTV
jgi:SAM-dependent methyltransferase